MNRKSFNRNRVFSEHRACQICESTDRLNIHHKDGDSSNNSPDNAQVLCHNCHLKAHSDLLYSGITKEQYYAIVKAKSLLRTNEEFEQDKSCNLLLLPRTTPLTKDERKQIVESVATKFNVDFNWLSLEVGEQLS